MKLKRVFKLSLAITFIGLYGTGFLYWWLVTRHPPHPDVEPAASGPVLLHSHALFGLWSMILFGYLFHAHIQPALKTRRRRVSGLMTLMLGAVLILTVPGLYYLVNEEKRAMTSALHTYLGLFFIVPTVSHSLRFKQRRSPREVSRFFARATD